MRKKLETLAIWGLLFCAVLFLIPLLGIATQSPEAATAFTWMPMPPLFGLIYGRKIFDWKKLEKVPGDEKRLALVKTASTFVRKILSRPLAEGGKIAGHDGNLTGAPPIVLIQSDTLKAPDRGYEMLFDEVDMRQSNNDTFEVLDVSGGVTFYQQIAGEEVKMSKIPKSAKTSVGFLRFSGGLNIPDDWLRFNKFYLIDRLFEDTIKRWFGQKADLFYGMIAALSNAINEAFATDDVTTINNACAAILENLSAAGYDVDENAEFVIVCNPKLRGRIFKALAASFVNANTNNNQIIFNIRAVVSTTKLANTSYYVVLPGEKSQRGEWDDLNMRPPQRDETKLGASHIWTGAYNGIIGEAKQYRRCALS